MKKYIWEDIHMIALVDFEEAHIDFKVYEITGRTADKKGSFTIPNFEKKGAKSSEDMTLDIEEAQTFISGSIKWDACSHVYFGDEGYIHVCGGSNWKQLIETEKRIFNIAREYFNKEHQKEYFDEFDK